MLEYHRLFHRNSLERRFKSNYTAPSGRGGWISIPRVLNFHRWTTQCGYKYRTCEFWIRRRLRRIVPRKSSPGMQSKAQKSTSYFSAPWKNMRPNLENPRRRFKLYNPLVQRWKRCTPQGQTRTNPRMHSSPPLLFTGQSTDCLMHATIPSLPSSFHRTLSRRRWIFAYAVGGASNEFYEPAYRLHGLI